MEVGVSRYPSLVSIAAAPFKATRLFEQLGAVILAGAGTAARFGGHGRQVESAEVTGISIVQEVPFAR